MDEILSPTIAYAEEVSSFGTGCLLLGRFRISIYEEFQTLKKPIQVMEKYGKGDLFRNPFFRNVQKNCKRTR
jgi:hypothetical protein